MEEITQSGYRIENIILTDSKFSRIHNIQTDPALIKSNADIQVNAQQVEGKLVVVETLIYTQTFNEVEEVKVEITMVGLFQIIGTPKLDVNTFGEQNAPAIIFPYIREFLTSLASRGGIGLVILPPFNFTKKKQIQKDSEKKEA